MIGINSILLPVCRKMEFKFQVRWYKGIGRAPPGKQVLVAGQHNKVYKIKGPGFKHPHDLNTFQRFPEEWKGCFLHHPCKQPGESLYGFDSFGMGPQKPVNLVDDL